MRSFFQIVKAHLLVLKKIWKCRKNLGSGRKISQGSYCSELTIFWS